MQTNKNTTKQNKKCNRQYAAKATHLLQLGSRAAAAARRLALVQITQRTIENKPEIGAVDVLCFAVGWYLRRLLQKHTE
jgi:hypothetical protein